MQKTTYSRYRSENKDGSVAIITVKRPIENQCFWRVFLLRNLTEGKFRKPVMWTALQMVLSNQTR